MRSLEKQALVIKAFMKTGECRLTLSMIASLTGLSVQAVDYHLKQLTGSMFLSKEENFYYINPFFLDGQNMGKARESMRPFIEFFIEYFDIPDELSDGKVEEYLVRFIGMLCQLFTIDGNMVGNQKDKSIQKTFEKGLKEPVKQGIPGE